MYEREKTKKLFDKNLFVPVTGCQGSILEPFNVCTVLYQLGQLCLDSVYVLAVYIMM